jgi:hypothetical protein
MYQKAQSALQARPLDVVRNLFTSQPAAAPAPEPEIEALRLRVQELENRLQAERQKGTAAKRKPAKKRQI